MTPTMTLSLTISGAPVMLQPHWRMSSTLTLPQLAAGLLIERDDVIVERADEDAAARPRPRRGPRAVDDADLARVLIEVVPDLLAGFGVDAQRCDSTTTDRYITPSTTRGVALKPPSTLPVWKAQTA